MDTKTKLTQALKEALRNQNDLRKRTIRLALAEIKNAEIERKSTLDETDVFAILQKEVKSRRETIEGAQQAGREDLIKEAQAEIAVLETFLPKPLSHEELEVLAKDVIGEVGATSPRDMGRVMQALIPKVKGKADGKEVSQIVQRLLKQ